MYILVLLILLMLTRLQTLTNKIKKNRIHPIPKKTDNRVNNAFKNEIKQNPIKEFTKKIKKKKTND